MCIRDSYARVLQDKAAARGFVYGSHYAPHDVLAKELGSGRSREEQARRLGLRFTVVPRHRVDDGINAVRAILPRCWFDAERAGEGIEALRQYRAAFDERGGALSERPVHDRYSHGADAFRYLAMGLRDRVRPVMPADPDSFDRTFARHRHARRDANDGLI